MRSFKHILLFAIITAFFSGCTNECKKSVATTAATPSWQSTFDTSIAEFGHRNWIVIADYAYPSQNSEGINTIVTYQDQVEVLAYVLGQIEKSPHVKPIIMLDKELEYVSEKDAHGINAYKTSLKSLISGKEVSDMPHEDIIKQLDEGSKLFKVLILKTRMIIPYTSVFIKLDCAYWNADKEKRLRDNFAKTINENR